MTLIERLKIAATSVAIALALLGWVAITLLLVEGPWWLTVPWGIISLCGIAFGATYIPPIGGGHGHDLR